MYFPYLKLRQQESLAVRNTVCRYADNKVVPVLEPYCENEAELYNYRYLTSTIEDLISSNKKFILIIDDENNLSVLKSRFINFNNYCIRGYYNDNPLVTNYQGTYDVAIIHRDRTIIIQDNNNIKYHIMMPSVLRSPRYINNYPIEKIVNIENGFIKYSPNYKYPVSGTFDADGVFTFRQDGHAGFGDFTILEEGYDVPSGAQADKVTHVIHLTRKQDAVQKLEVYHYLTTPAMEPDNRRRSELTIEKAYNDRHRFLHTLGIQLIIDKYPQASSPAYYKRIGIIHHIELMHSLV